MYISDPGMVLYIVPASLIQILAVQVFLLARERRYAGSGALRTMSGFFQALEKELGDKGKSVLCSLSYMERGAEEKTAGFACMVRMRMSLGYDFGNSVRLASRASKALAMQGLHLDALCAPNASDLQTIGTVSRAIHNEIEEQGAVATENGVGAFQRYMAIGMVFSTILPSISLFAFIGYSIFSYSEYQLLAFSIALCTAFPTISMLINLKAGEIHG
jgi:hypothetical protein